MPTTQSLDLLYFFNLLLTRWRFLLVGTLIIMVVAAVGTYVAEETYESSARLLVSSPKFVGGLDVFPRELSEPTFGQMAQSGVVFEDLIQVMRMVYAEVADQRNDEAAALRTAEDILASGSEELAARFGWDPHDTKIMAIQGLSPKDIAGLRLMKPEQFRFMDARTLAEILEVKAEIEFEGPNVIRWEPVIELRARSNAPGTAAAVANIWARITLEHVRTVVELGTTEALDQLGEAYANARNAVASAQEKIKNLNQTAMGEIKKERFDSLLYNLYGQHPTIQSSGFVRQFSVAQARVEELEKSVISLQERINQVEFDVARGDALAGEWVGLLPGSEDMINLVQQAKIPDEATEAQEVARSRDALLAAYQALRLYKEEHPIAVERSRLRTALEDLDEARTERNALAALAKVSAATANASREVAQLEERARQLQQEIAETNDRIATMEEGIRLRETELARAEDKWAAFRDEYIRLRKELLSRHEELLSRRAEAGAYARQIEAASGEVERLNREIQDFEAELATLQTELAGREKALEQVSQLHAQVELASRTPFVSLKLISAAPIPKTRVSPKRKLVVLVAGFIGFILLGAWLIARDNLRRYREVQAAA
jgi:LPS O-antigen subunit length determinant protein (WzzB/FepE family)